MGPSQAPVGQTGQVRDRNTVKKGYRFTEAREAAAAAMEVLEHHFEGHQWLEQAREGLELYIHRCIEQFAGTPQPSNHGPIQNGADYRAYARSAEEIKQTMAAEQGVVSRAPRQVPRYRQVPDEVEIPESEIADPMQQEQPAKPLPRKPDGWLL